MNPLKRKAVVALVTVEDAAKDPNFQLLREFHQDHEVLDQDGEFDGVVVSREWFVDVCPLEFFEARERAALVVDFDLREERGIVRCQGVGYRHRVPGPVCSDALVDP